MLAEARVQDLESETRALETRLQQAESARVTANGAKQLAERRAALLESRVKQLRESLMVHGRVSPASVPKRIC